MGGAAHVGGAARTPFCAKNILDMDCAFLFEPPRTPFRNILNAGFAFENETPARTETVTVRSAPSTPVYNKYMAGCTEQYGAAGTTPASQVNGKFVSSLPSGSEENPAGEISWRVLYC